MVSSVVSSARMRSTARTWSNTSPTLPATSAPARRTGSQRSAVRFQTTSLVPARTRVRAIGVGHDDATAGPGATGNFALAGHG